MQIQAIKLLLVEDDDEDVILLKKHLSRIVGARYEVTWTTSYAQGFLDMLKCEHDLCLLDYRLGAQNGIELIAAVRAQGYKLPIVLLTGAHEAEIDIQALQAGADDYIDKGHLQGELLHRVIRYAIERKKAEVEREKLLSEQIATRELEKRRNEFIGIVAHELKTPLTSLKGYTQLLGKKFMRAGDEQNVLFITRMDRQLVRLTGLIDDFLDVTRITDGKLQLREDFFSFDPLVEEMIAELQLITERHRINLEGETNQIIWGDRLRIGQVIANLISNAIKYSPLTDLILIKTGFDEHGVQLSVQDFGPGIPRDQQMKIFEPFYRVESAELPSASGLGLGLHIAAEITHRQGGKIWVESEEGQGALFCVSLPFDHRKLTTISQEPANSSI